MSLFSAPLTATNLRAERLNIMFNDCGDDLPVFETPSGRCLQTEGLLSSPELLALSPGGCALNIDDDMSPTDCFNDQLTECTSVASPSNIRSFAFDFDEGCRVLNTDESPIIDKNLYRRRSTRTLLKDVPASPSIMIPSQPAAVLQPVKDIAAAKPKPAVALREAVPSDAVGIIALRNSLDMTNATSFVWDEDDMARRIRDRYPMIIVATAADPREDSPTCGEEMVVGVAGIDLGGMEKDFPIMSIGSRLLGVAAGTDYVFPDTYCMCRGLLIHPLFQGAGLGSKLHKGRMKLLAAIAPNTAGVILSARGSTFEETMAVVLPQLDEQRDNITPEFNKATMLEFTFHTSEGIVHMVHGRERDGWKFVGIDTADGGPVWIIGKPLTEVVSSYDVDIALPMQ